MFLSPQHLKRLNEKFHELQKVLDEINNSIKEWESSQEGCQQVEDCREKEFEQMTNENEQLNKENLLVKTQKRRGRQSCTSGVCLSKYISSEKISIDCIIKSGDEENPELKNFSNLEENKTLK